MSTTLSQLRTDARSEIKIDPNGKIWTDSVMNDYINQAYLQLQSDLHFQLPGNDNGSATISLVAGTQEYALDSTFGQMELVLLGSTRIFERQFEEIKIRNPLNTQGTPSDYYIRGNNIGFDPIPNSSATVTYYFRKILADLTSDSDVIGLTDRAVSALVKYVAYLAWSSPRGEYNTAQAKLNDYEKIKNMLLHSFLLRDRSALTLTMPRNKRANYYPDRIFYP